MTELMSLKNLYLPPVETIDYLSHHFKVQDYDSFFVAIGDNKIRSDKYKMAKEL